MLRWAGSLAAMLALVVFVAIWRLMSGPIELDWLSPYVEAAFDRSGTGLKVAVSGVRIALNRTSHQLDLRAEGVHIAMPDGKPLASFPELTTSFGLGSLLRGRLSPSQVIVERPFVHLVRSETGAIAALVSGEQDTAGSTPGDVGPQVLEQFAAPPGAQTPFGLLRRISIRRAMVIVDDRHSGRSWQAKQVDISIERGPTGVRGDISFAMPIGRSQPELHASYRYLSERQLLDLDLAIDGVEPGAIPPLTPELLQLRHIAAPVSGTLTTRIDLKDGAAQGSRLDVVLGAGQLNSEWLANGGIAIEGGALHATYAPESQQIKLTGTSLKLGGGSEVVVDGTLSDVTPEMAAAPIDVRPSGHVKGDLSVRLLNLPTSRFGELWPLSFNPGGRRWTLANVHDGTLDEAAAQFTIDLDPVKHVAEVLSSQGSLRYHDLTVTFFKGLPPVKKVMGTATFAHNELDFVPTSGVLKGIKLTGGQLRLTNLGAPTEWLTIDLTMSGPLQDALEVLDTKPLRYIHTMGLDPAQIGGRADTQLHFKLPLFDDLKFDQVEYGAKATLIGASAAKAALDRDITEGALTLEVARTGAHLRGTARFDGVPTTLDANVVFQSASEPRATYRVGMTLDPDAQHRLGLDIMPDRLDGPIGVEAVYTSAAGPHSRATAKLDLKNTALTVAEAGWSKPAGVPAAAKLAIEFENERMVRIPHIEVTAPGLDGRLTAQLAADHKSLDRIDIRHLSIGNSEFAGMVSRRTGGGWRADVHAGYLDAHHLLKEAGADTPVSGSSPPLAITARIDRLALGPRRELQNVSAELLRVGGIWQSGAVAGRFSNSHQLSLSFGQGGGNRLLFESDDLGATLKLLDIVDNVVGGRVSLDGELSEAAGKRVLRAQIDGSNYTVTRASALARLLALPSLTGLASALSGKGIWFSTLRGDIIYSGGRIDIERMLASGESLGITANGWFDADRDRLELQGTVAPAYALNSIAGHLPIIGPMLAGGSQGLIAANYRLSGPSGDPQIAVNPLSALTPGILRQVFAPLVGFAPPARSQAALQ